ncbi:MAG TPA: hypothetical protein VL093_07480 [Flavipsychrobacter sp.]|jgi:hypothetical protein|nr:hypothetical protein [Flavipsychrobacter sp.]
MWSRRNKVWLHYQRNIIAADVYSAVFLSAYTRHANIQRLYSWQMEVIDLQKYKKLTKPNKVHRAIKERAEEPFVFIVGKN